jgi:hypothetical protein
MSRPAALLVALLVACARPAAPPDAAGPPAPSYKDLALPYKLADLPLFTDDEPAAVKQCLLDQYSFSLNGCRIGRLGANHKVPEGMSYDDCLRVEYHGLRAGDPRWPRLGPVAGYGPACRAKGRRPPLTGADP